ncbi:MAG TPA: NAD(P)H-hydrate dehydratase [Nitrososphaerales archaeon]|nr:NAD(P)H-hydrate dehydratase [Nitrososphaerales archaeon]
MEEFEVDASRVAEWVPPKSRNAHKRMNGTVCVIGGSRLYHGAPFLCASGAMRSGVDLVYIAVPASISVPIRALSPDFIVVPLPDARLTRGNVSKLATWVRAVDCYAVGPGLGPQRPADLASCVNRLKGGAKLVLDADILRPEVLVPVKGTSSVVTPHSGEFERLFGEKLPGDLSERASLAAKKAREWGVIVLLKGPTDVITDGSRTALNNNHSPAMTVGGTGDVLTGVTAGLLARGMQPFEAACSAAYINGAAGKLAAEELGLHIVASDVANRIANAMKRFDSLS